MRGVVAGSLGLHHTLPACTTLCLRTGVSLPWRGSASMYFSLALYQVSLSVGPRGQWWR